MTEPSDSLVDRLLGAAFTAPKAATPAAGAPADAPFALAISGRYRIEGEIGRGGVGIVLRGRDLELNRDVAIKILRPEHQEHTGLTRRLVEEAQIGGQLEHPGIVPVHELGRAPDGRPFFAMKLIQGRTFSEILKERRDPAADRGRFIAIFEQVCQTVAYAHARGVIHRDLKPANIMVGAFGEVAVADWGLAKVIGRPEPESGPSTAPATRGSTTAVSTARSTSPEMLSQAGSVLGTLAYMPPEQARGQSDQVDARSDVFALGAMLCEILTGAPPYSGETTEVFEAAREAQIGPAIARLDGCAADADLVELAKRCLAVLPADRPRHAGDVADAVARHRAALQERAHAAELAANAAQARASEERRARRLTGALAATIVVAALGGGGVYLSVERSRRERQEKGAVTVRDAMRPARELLTIARAAPPHDVAPWRAALTAADGAVAAANAGDPGDALRGETTELRAEIAAGLAHAEEAAATRLRDRELLESATALTGKFAIQPWDELDLAYERLFKEWGLDFATMTQEQLVARLRAASDPVAVCDFLLAWMGVRAMVAMKGRTDIQPREPKDFQLMMEVMQLADPDPWRVRIRAAIPFGVKDLVSMIDDPQLETVEPRTIAFLGTMFGRFGAREDAIRLGRKAARLLPQDYRIHLDLATWLADDKTRLFAESLEHVSAAVAIAPDFASTWLLLAVARDGTGDFEGAIAACDRVIELDARSSISFVLKAEAQLRRGDVDGALATLRAGLASLPGDDALRFELARAQLQAGDLAGARAGLIELARTPRELATVADAAELLLIVDEAAIANEILEATLQRTTPMTPDDVKNKLRFLLAAGFQAAGRFDDAIAQMRIIRAERASPDQESAEGKRLDAVIESMTLLADGFPDFATGAREPASPLEAAKVALMLEQHGTTAFATDMWMEALAKGEDEIVANMLLARPMATRAALRAAEGDGDDAATLPAEVRARYRNFALRLLRADLEHAMEADVLDPAAQARSQVEFFFLSPALVGFRDPSSREKLPASEAAAWEQLFEDARAALRRMRGSGI